MKEMNEELTAERTEAPETRQSREQQVDHPQAVPDEESTAAKPKKKKRRRKKRKKYWYVPILVVLAALAIGTLVFFSVFYITEVEVVGNTRYTSSEMEEMTFTTFLRRNSLYLAYYEKVIEPEDIAFIDSIDIEYMAHNSVRLHVNEDSPIGYIQQGGMNYYFNVEGIVIEAASIEEAAALTGEKVVSSANESVSASSSSEDEMADSDPETENGVASDEAETAEEDESAETEVADADDHEESAETGSETNESEDGVESDGEALQAQAITAEAIDATDADGAMGSGNGASGSAIGSGTSGSATTDGTAEDDEATGLTDSKFKPALTGIPLVTGLTSQTVRVGDVVHTEDESIFQTILALTRMMSKFEMTADEVELDSDYNITLHYGGIKVSLGQDTLMEDKMTRVAAIMPKLDGMEGTLHLEVYTEETTNIIFDPKEYEDALKAAEEEAAAAAAADGMIVIDSADGSIEGYTDGSDAYADQQYANGSTDSGDAAYSDNQTNSGGQTDTGSTDSSDTQVKASGSVGRDGNSYHTNIWQVSGGNS